MSNWEILSAGALEAAPALIGWTLIHQTPAGTTAGVITETEAYREDDPASHSFRGETTRNSSMFNPPGTAYVYLSYGIHYCLNVTCAAQGTGEAVLIRSLLPTEGITLMQARRKTSSVPNLCSGPGKLTQAMGITITQNGQSLQSPPLLLLPGTTLPSTATPRIGISQAREHPWRFVVASGAL